MQDRVTIGRIIIGKVIIEKVIIIERILILTDKGKEICKLLVSNNHNLQ